MSQEEADAAYFDKKSELNKVEDSEEFKALKESIRPVLDRYQETLDDIPDYLDMLELDTYIKALGENDREALALVVNSGILIGTSEGYSYLTTDNKFLHGLIKHRLSGDAQAYMALADLQPQSNSDFNMIEVVKEKGDWAAAWETFISEHPDNRHKERAAERYNFFMEIMICDLPIEEDWIKGMNAVAAKHKGTLTASLVSEYVTAVEKNGRKFSQSTQNKFWQKFASAFVEVDKVCLDLTGDNVNIRPAPDAKSNVLRKVSRESRVYFIADAETLTDATGMDWYRIVYRVKDGVGERAYWIPKDWLGQDAAYISSNYVRVGDLDEHDKEFLKGQ